jgi:sodium transport system permease protein
MLLNIYIKELKDCFRDRRTLLLSVFLPVIMMTGLTFFYEKLVSDGSDEVYTLAVDTAFSTEAEQLFAGFPNIQIEPVPDPEQSVADGDAHAALLADHTFSANIQNGSSSSITIIGNSYSENSAHVINAAAGALSKLEKEIVQERLQNEGVEASLVQPFNIEQKEISSEDGTINLLAMLIPLILAIAIGTGSGPAASDLFAGEKERKTMEALLMTPVSRTTLLTAKWLTISTVGVLTGFVALVVVSLEIAFLTENLRKAVNFGGQFAEVLGFALLITVIYSMFNAALLMLTSLIAKTIKESQSYSTPVMMIGMFPMTILSSIGVNELTFHHFAIPILNLFSVLKELIVGVVDYEHLFLMIGTNLLCMAVFLIIGRLLFLKDKWVMN